VHACFLENDAFHLYLSGLFLWQHKRTALMFALEKGHVPIVDALVSAKADMNAVDGVRLI
jgi:hypothetical protein